MDKDFKKFKEYLEVDEDLELDGYNDSDILDESVVEIEDDEGVLYKYYHLGEIEYNDKKYAFFSLAEEVEGMDNDDIYVYEVDAINNELIEVEDDALIDELFLQFASIYKGEYLEDEENFS